jgi:hypothetical protein
MVISWTHAIHVYKFLRLVEEFARLHTIQNFRNWLNLFKNTFWRLFKDFELQSSLFLFIQMFYSLFIKGNNSKSFSFLTDGRYKVTLSRLLKVFVVRWDSYCHADESVLLVIYVVLVNHSNHRYGIFYTECLGLGVCWLRDSLPNLSVMCIMY